MAKTLFQWANTAQTPKLQSLNGFLCASKSASGFMGEIRNLVGEEVAIINTKGDGNCGPRAAVQAILLDGFTKSDKATHIAYLEDLFKQHQRVQNASLGGRSVFTEDQFFQFIQSYKDCNTFDEIKKFCQKYFDARGVDDIPIFSLAAYLRFDMDSYWREEAQEEERWKIDTTEYQRVLTIDQWLDMGELAGPYFIGKGINFDVISRGDCILLKSERESYKQSVDTRKSALNRESLEQNVERLKSLEDRLFPEQYGKIIEDFVTANLAKEEAAKAVITTVRELLSTQSELKVKRVREALGAKFDDFVNHNILLVEEQRVIATQISEHRDTKKLPGFKIVQEALVAQQKITQDLDNKRSATIRELEGALGGQEALQRVLTQAGLATDQNQQAMHKINTQLAKYQATQEAPITARILNSNNHYGTVVPISVLHALQWQVQEIDQNQSRQDLSLLNSSFVKPLAIVLSVLAFTTGVCLEMGWIATALVFPPGVALLLGSIAALSIVTLLAKRLPFRTQEAAAPISPLSKSSDTPTSLSEQETSAQDTQSVSLTEKGGLFAPPSTEQSCDLPATKLKVS